MMKKTKKDRQDEKGEFAIAKDNEFDKVGQLLEKQQELKDRKEDFKKNKDKFTERGYSNQMVQLKREKKENKIELIQELKLNFKHIEGMWPKTANFENEKQMLKSWQTTSVINKKVYKPSKRLIVCQQGVNDLSAKMRQYDDFLDHFRDEKDRRKKSNDGISLRGSL